MSPRLISPYLRCSIMQYPTSWSDCSALTLLGAHFVNQLVELSVASSSATLRENQMGIFHHHHHLRRQLGSVKRRSQLKAPRRIALRKSSLEVQRCVSSAPIKKTATCGKPAAYRSTSRICLHHLTSTCHHPSAALISPHQWLAWSSLSTRHYEATHSDALWFSLRSTSTSKGRRIIYNTMQDK